MWAGQERIHEVEAWLEAVSASAIFRDNGFGPEVTEVLVLLTREGQRLMYGVSASWQKDVKNPRCWWVRPTALGQRLVCEKP